MRPDGLRLRALGAEIDVVFGDGFTPELAAALRRAWSRCLDAEAAPVPDVTLPPGSGETPLAPNSAWRPMIGDAAPGALRASVRTAHAITSIEAESPERFASELTSTVTLRAIEARAGELLMLHAAALADPATGRAVAFVGRSGMGKTTVTRVLGAGWGYVTDETVALDRSGFLVPYAKPLSLIADDPGHPKRQIGPDDAGLRRSPHEATLGAVVLLDRCPDDDASADAAAGRPQVVELSHAEAVVELAPHTSSLARIDRPLAWLCSTLDAAGGAVRVRYRDARDLEALLPSLLDREPLHRAWASALQGPSEPDSGADCPAGADRGGGDKDAAANGGLVRRAQVVDAVTVTRGDGTEELLAMVGHCVLRLSGIAPTVWRALDTPLSLAGIAERIAPEVGLPEGYEASLAAAIDELESNGLVQKGMA
ncbi:PqqD family protein [Sinomonas sp. JGH33]|uniref:PqqD family protein n=1 Tax=Sinomonas terricola TaxID=3110330 RepID=A0ABU5T269_9MICC|nr:PqqD family protein [Sinomonas sp. JGH33]MEA5453665.1 PqqD family protein [Sinomonas sp. JGH33]